MKNTNDEIERIASEVLGKGADGRLMAQYQTPDRFDASLLVAIPRHLNRDQYGLNSTALPFVGSDTWNGYEFSCLLDNGFPLNGRIRWVYAADSPNIVESKSVKLYLNSFNMCRLGNSPEQVINRVRQQIAHDLAQQVGSSVEVAVFTQHQESQPAPFSGDWQRLEQVIDVTSLHFVHQHEDPSLLQVMDLQGQTIRVFSTVLRSNCRVTHQPDWGDVYIHIRGRQGVTLTSLLRYLVSMRQENHFHEEICECIYQRLFELLQPDELLVGCLYTRRGGIDINPTRANHAELLAKQPITRCDVLTQSSLRQ